MYTPLYFSQMLNIENIPDKSGWKNIFKNCMEHPEEVFSFLWNTQDPFCVECDGITKVLQDAAVNHRGELYKISSGSSEIPKEKEQDIALLQESVSLFLMENTWAKDKEVYRFDAEMELALTDTENVDLPLSVLDRLPYNCFYIDFAENGIYKANFHGAFVYIVPYNNGYIVCVQRVKEDGRSMFGHVVLIPQNDDRNCVYKFRREDITAPPDKRNLDWQEFGFFLLNALLYLCAANSEIEENPDTKKTYRKPGTVIKNKYSEIRKWDCGFRYGQTVRMHKASAKNDISSSTPKSIERTLPSPHTRRAHWHHYWTGKGRTELIVKWLPPKIGRAHV